MLIDNLAYKIQLKRRMTKENLLLTTRDLCPQFLPLVELFFQRSHIAVAKFGLTWPFI